MKIYKLLPLILLLVCNNAYGAYTGTMPKDIGTSTPLGSENPNILDDVIRERGTVQVNLYKLKFVGTDTTLLANDTWVVGSSSTAMLITMPAASSCANSSVTKPFVITNYSTGTITLNISVDGVGSPTVSGSQTMSLFTDGTRWYEIRSKNAYDSDYLGGVIATGYARSGANSDITAITGLTTFLAVGQGGSGTNTAAGAASAFGVGTEDSPEFTGLNVTSTGTVTTLNSTTGNVTNLLTTTGTVTTLNSTTGNITNQVTTTGTITTLNSTTGNVTNLVTTTGTVTTLNSTTGNITTGNVTNLVTTTGTVTTLNSTTGNITNLVTTNGTITTFNSTTGNITNQVTTTGTITTLNNTNLTTTTGTVTTLYNTDFSGGSGTFTGNINADSASGFNYLSKWTTGSHTAGGTGTVRFQGTGDIITSSTYDNNGNGTITHALSVGVSAKPDAKVDGVIQVSGPTAYDFPGAFFSITGSSTDAVLTHKNISLGTQTNGSISLGTQTNGSISLGTQTNGNLPFTSMSGSTTASQLPLISGLLGSATSSQLPINATFIGTQSTFGTTTRHNSSSVTIYGGDGYVSPLSVVVANYAGTNTTAIMSSNGTPSPYQVIPSSEVNGDQQGYEAFDNIFSNTTSNGWMPVSGTNEYIVYNFGTGTSKEIGSYIITANITDMGGSDRAPYTFNLSGSSDNINFTSIDARTAQTFSSALESKSYTIATSTTAYQFFKLYISTSSVGTYIAIAEIQLMEGKHNYNSVYINGSGTVHIGTTTANSTTTAYIFQVAGSGLATSWGVTCYEAIKSIIGSGSDTIAEAYDAVMGVKLFKHHPKTSEVTLQEARTSAIRDYKEQFRETDYQTFLNEKKHTFTSYDVNGSETVAWDYLNDVFEENYMRPRVDEFYVLPDMNKRINDKKVDMESDTSVTSITPVSDHPSTPDIFKRHDKKILDLEPQIGALMGTAQYQDLAIKELEAVVGSLTSRLNNAGL